MQDVNPAAVPMDLNIKLTPNLDNNKLNHSNSYAKLSGCLQFISNSTQLDISYAVNKLATYTTNPGLQHHSAIKRILRYLAGMETLGITYHNTPDETDNNLFHGYADAIFANTDNHKSTTGYIFLGSGGAVTFCSIPQTPTHFYQFSDMRSIVMALGGQC